MSFPHDDPAWADAASFLRPLLAPVHSVVAPDPFRWAIPRASRFGQIGAATPRDFDWIVVHKGQLDQVPRDFLLALSMAAIPVHANDVFVVFALAPPAGLADISDSDHVRAFQNNVMQLPIDFGGEDPPPQIPAPAPPPPPRYLRPISLRPPRSS